MNGFNHFHYTVTLFVGLACLAPFSFADGGIDDSPSIGLNFTNNGEFEVLHSRATATGTGAAVAGLVGAMIESGIESSKDAKREQELIPQLKTTNCASDLTAGFQKIVERNGNYQLAADSKEADVTLNVKVRSCGFRVVDTNRVLLSSYVELNYDFSDEKRNTNKQDQYIYMTGKKRFSWEEIKSNKETANREFESALFRAGKRLANKFLYR